SHDWIVHDPVFLGDLDTLQPFRKSFRHVFLEKSLFTDAGRKAFHGHGTANDMREHHGRDHPVVSSEFPFCNPVMRKQSLFGMSNHHVSLCKSFSNACRASRGNGMIERPSSQRMSKT